MSKEVEILREHIKTHRTVLSMCGEPEDVVLNRLLDDFESNEDKIAELEEQLRNAIVPKFKIGQEVWFIDPEGDVSSGDVWKIEINCIQTLYTVFWGNECEDIYCEYELFATKEEAEQRLKEIKSGN